MNTYTLEYTAEDGTRRSVRTTARCVVITGTGIAFHRRSGLQTEIPIPPSGYTLTVTPFRASPGSQIRRRPSAPALAALAACFSLTGCGGTAHADGLTVILAALAALFLGLTAGYFLDKSKSYKQGYDHGEWDGLRAARKAGQNRRAARKN